MVLRVEKVSSKAMTRQHPLLARGTDATPSTRWPLAYRLTPRKATEPAAVACCTRVGCWTPRDPAARVMRYGSEFEAGQTKRSVGSRRSWGRSAEACTARIPGDQNRVQPLLRRIAEQLLRSSGRGTTLREIQHVLLPCIRATYHRVAAVTEKRSRNESPFGCREQALDLRPVRGDDSNWQLTKETLGDKL